MNHYDVVVLGGGPAGERAAIGAARAGRRVAIVERHRVVGGTAINWGAIPSKTLRESAMFWRALTRDQRHGIKVQTPAQLTVADFMWRERQVVQRELELMNRGLVRYQIEVFQGRARFVDAHSVSVQGADNQSRTQLWAEVVIIATGSSPHRPPDVPFDNQCLFDSDTILQMPCMPRSMVVLGAGVIGIEYAAMFAALGIEVTLVDTRSELLPYLDREIARILEHELQRLGMIILHDDHYQTIEIPTGAPSVADSDSVAASDERLVRCYTQAGNLLEADVLLYCVGRDGNTADLGLETIGITPNARGLIQVNEHFQTQHPHIYAVGDVIGYPALASTSMEQGRQAVRHAFDLPGPLGTADVLPFAIYAVPEVAYIGETEETLKRKSIPYVAGRGVFRLNPRGQILGDEGGLLKLLFHAETDLLLGVHIIGTSASELVHIGQAFLHQGTTAQVIAETLYNYPTLSDLYRHAAFDFLRQKYPC